MIDDFIDAINALNKAARDLLENAHQLDDEIGRAQSLARLDKLKGLTQKLCEGMRGVVELLGPQQPVLERFFKKTRGVAYVARSREALDGFLKEHEAKLRELGVSDAAIAKLKRALGKETKGSGSTVEADAKEMLAGVRELQQLICQSAVFIDKLAGATDVLKGCVKGAMGVATIVIDITGLLTIPDVTGIVIFKAVKSTLVGGNMVRKAVGSIKKGFKKLKIRPGRTPKAGPTKPVPPENPAAAEPKRPEPNYPRPSPEDRERLKLKPNPKPDDKDKS
jgi:hypothetical protein